MVHLGPAPVLWYGLANAVVVQRRVAAAFKVALIEANLDQDRLHRAHMLFLARVTGAQQGQLGMIQTKARGTVGQQEGQGLEGLEGGSGKGLELGVARIPEQLALYVGHGNRTHMDVFDDCRAVRPGTGGVDKWDRQHGALSIVGLTSW